MRDGRIRGRERSRAGRFGRSRSLCRDRSVRGEREHRVAKRFPPKSGPPHRESTRARARTTRHCGSIPTAVPKRIDSCLAIFANRAGAVRSWRQARDKCDPNLRNHWRYRKKSPRSSTTQGPTDHSRRLSRAEGPRASPLPISPCCESADEVSRSCARFPAFRAGGAIGKARAVVSAASASTAPPSDHPAQRGLAKHGQPRDAAPYERIPYQPGPEREVGNPAAIRPFRWSPRRQPHESRGLHAHRSREILASPERACAGPPSREAAEWKPAVENLTDSLSGMRKIKVQDLPICRRPEPN